VEECLLSRVQKLLKLVRITGAFQPREQSLPIVTLDQGSWHHHERTRGERQLLPSQRKEQDYARTPLGTEEGRERVLRVAAACALASFSSSDFLASTRLFRLA
jgi:hypothetical protein